MGVNPVLNCINKKRKNVNAYAFMNLKSLEIFLEAVF